MTLGLSGGIATKGPQVLGKMATAAPLAFSRGASSVLKLWDASKQSKPAVLFRRRFFPIVSRGQATRLDLMRLNGEYIRLDSKFQLQYYNEISLGLKDHVLAKMKPETQELVSSRDFWLFSKDRGPRFETWVQSELGASPGFRIERQFDGAFNDVWIEVKSGNYWNTLLSDSDTMGRFRSTVGDCKKIAANNHKEYTIYSEAYIPESIKEFLNKKNVKYVEHYGNGMYSDVEHIPSIFLKHNPKPR